MNRARDEIDAPRLSSAKSIRQVSEMGLLSSKQEDVKDVKVKITELNETFDVKVYGADKYSAINFPSYIDLNSATSNNTYNQHKSSISQHLKNKPKYICNLNDIKKLPTILNYFTKKEIISLNMDYIENNECLLSFMLSPYKDSVFFEDTSDSGECDFSISLTAHITDEIAISLFLCKCTLYLMCTLYSMYIQPDVYDMYVIHAGETNRGVAQKEAVTGHDVNERGLTNVIIT